MSNAPVVYACSGCSNVARIAHDIALNLDSDGLAEMSCVSGVIGNVIPVREIATSAQQIIVIDGCGLQCTKACLDACQIKVDHHFVITEFDIEKRGKWQDSIADNGKAMTHIYAELLKSGISFRAT